MNTPADHGTRDHATWSASATDRNAHCAGALTMAEKSGREDVESIFAAWGTAAHIVSERCFLNETDAADYVGETVQTKSHAIEVDDEVAETAQMYVDYVRDRVAEYKRETGGEPFVMHEQKFSLEALKPPFDAGGICDTVIYFLEWRLLEVVDLKGGRGVVEAAGNAQMRSYAIGALLKNREWPTETVRTTIVQPRAGHKDGRIRSETLMVGELVEWTAELVAAMKRAKQAQDEWGAMPEAAWEAKWLKPGKCKFCRVEGSCPALERAAMDAVGVWFDDLDQPQISNSPFRDKPEELSRTLDLLDMIQDWMNARRAFAQQLAESGVEIPNYILVEAQGREKWNEGSEAQVVDAIKQSGKPADKFYNPAKLKSPKQVKKSLGKKFEHLVDGISHTPVNGTNLVRADKTTRSAVPPAVNRFFETIEE